ncbi:MAG: hypoxanthine phosphoribosyltransferase [Candidatus Woesearchaeota archaeon]
MVERFVFSDRSNFEEADLTCLDSGYYHEMMGGNGNFAGILVSEEDKEHCLAMLADRITADYKNILGPDDALVVAPLLNGAMFFANDIMTRLYLPTELDTLKVETYGGGTRSTGEAKIHKDFSRSVKGRHVLLVEDIVDSGATLDFIINGLLKHKLPASVRVVSFLDKVAARKVPIPVDYVGFEIPEMFVVGYGLDYKHRLRNLPFVGVYKG